MGTEERLLQVSCSELVPIGGSFLCSLGGQGHAVGVGLSIGNDLTLAVPYSPRGDPARTILCLTVGDTRPMHPVAGVMQAQFALGTIDVADPSTVRLSNRMGNYQLDAGTIPVGRYLASASVFLSRPAFTTDSFSEVVTVDITLCGSVPLGTGSGHPGSGSGLSLRVSEYGFVMVDPRRFVEEVTRRVGAGTRDLISLIGSTELGHELAREGVFFPVWSIRPWVYRLAAGLGGYRLPLGREVIGRRLFPCSPGATELAVIPGEALSKWPGRIEEAWPRIAIPPGTGALSVSVFVSGGYEPIDPTLVVGIIPTFVLERSPVSVALDQEAYFIGTDPFGAYGIQELPNEQLLACD